MARVSLWLVKVLIYGGKITCISLCARDAWKCISLQIIGLRAKTKLSIDQVVWKNRLFSGIYENSSGKMGEHECHAAINLAGSLTDHWPQCSEWLSFITIFAVRNFHFTRASNLTVDISFFLDYLFNRSCSFDLGMRIIILIVIRVYDSSH